MLNIIKFDDTGNTMGRTVNLFCIRMFLEANSHKTEKFENITCFIFWTCCFHSKSLQKVNSNTKVIARMFTNLAGEFHEHKEEI